MRIEKIEGNKIRVTLSQEDLDNYHINIKMLRPDSPQLHTFLFKIMERVKRETGFNPYTGQIVVEATPSQEGIVLVVTKISEHKPKAVPAKDGIRVRAVKKAKLKRRIYYFESFLDLCGAFEHIQGDILGRCRLYCTGEKFYIVSENGIDQYDKITEFGTLIGHGEITEAFLAEHGRLIAQGNGLREMAVNVKNLK